MKKRSHIIIMVPILSKCIMDIAKRGDVGFNKYERGTTLLNLTPSRKQDLNLQPLPPQRPRDSFLRLF